MMKFVQAFAMSAIVAAGMGGCGAKQARKAEFPDNAFAEIPQSYFSDAEDGGIVTSIKYETEDYTGSGEKYEKNALIYLPSGYDITDDETLYDVFYLMHGGGGTENEIFGGALQSSDLKKVLDNMIEKGDLKPCIVVAPTYNNKFNGDATACCKYFWKELVNDLIPAVEGEYHTYCKHTNSAGIKASRLHRGFGGFSMGAACTWWVYENALDKVGYFMPVAGDSWSLGQGAGGYDPDGSAENLAKAARGFGYTWEDFYIYCGVGSNDNMAGPNMKPMIESMKKVENSDEFKWAENFRDGNFYFVEREGGWHDYNTVYRIVYNGLPKFFG